MPGLKRHERLRKRSEYQLLSKNGRKLYSANFLVLWNWSECQGRRIGLTVSRKIGNAVVRNRLKRLLREFFRNDKELFPAADFNIIARQGAEKLDFIHLCHELRTALQRIPRQKC